VVFDGIITQRVVDVAKKKGIRYLVGERLAGGVRVPEGLKILLLPEVREKAKAGSAEEGH